MHAESLSKQRKHPVEEGSKADREAPAAGGVLVALGLWLWRGTAAIACMWDLREMRAVGSGRRRRWSGPFHKSTALSQSMVSWARGPRRGSVGPGRECGGES